MSVCISGVIKEKLQKIKNDSDGIGNSTAKMANSLNEDVPKSDIKITNATRDAIEDLKNKIKNLRNKLKNINLDRTSDDFLKSVSNTHNWVQTNNILLILFHVVRPL